MTRINRAIIYVIYIYFGYASYVAFGRKRQKSKMAVTRHFEKTIFLTKNPIIKCAMSLLTNFEAWNPFLDLRLQEYAFFYLQAPHEGLNLISYTGKLKYSGPVVTCDMSLLAHCVAHNLFLVSMMMVY